jgi:hypothetical protein
MGTEGESQYLSRRGPAGWSTQNITPPFTVIKTQPYRPYGSLTFTPELSSGLTGSTATLTSETTPGYDNLYLAGFAERSSGASYQLLTNSAYVEPAQSPYSFRELPTVVGASTDLRRVVFYYGGPTYEWVDGKAYRVDIAPNGEPLQMEGAFAGAGNFWRSVSDNGLRVVMTSQSRPEQVYVRENPEQPQSPLNGEECAVSSDACTVEVSASQRTTPDPNGPQPALYRGASADGARVFFTSKAELTNDARTGPADNAANLYEYDLQRPEGERLKDLTVDEADADGAAVLGVVDISEDGSYVYFVAEGKLATGAVSGQPNLYLDHDGAITFIATLSSSDYNDWSGNGNGVEQPITSINSVRETPDGAHLAFLSTRRLTGYDNEQTATGECENKEIGRIGEGGQCREVYEYDANASSEPLTCVSCNRTGARPLGSSGFGDEYAAAAYRAYYIPRNFSEDGSRLFFESRDALAPQDSNGLQDVYEYENGHVHPISDVAGSYASFFLDASVNGNDVFIATADQLLPQDTDSRVDVYDAQVGGGFPVSVSPPACDNGDSCKPPVSPQPTIFGAPASATFSGSGNVAPIVSKPAVKPKPETRAEKLKKALKPCKKLKRKTKRLACERQANKKYGSVKKKAKRSSTHSKKGRK